LSEVSLPTEWLQCSH